MLSFPSNIPSGIWPERRPVAMSTPVTVPEVTVWVIGSSLRHVTFVPTLTVRSAGENCRLFNETTVPSVEDELPVLPEPEPVPVPLLPHAVVVSARDPARTATRTDR